MRWFESTDVRDVKVKDIRLRENQIVRIVGSKSRLEMFEKSSVLPVRSHSDMRTDYASVIGIGITMISSPDVGKFEFEFPGNRKPWSARNFSPGILICRIFHKSSVQRLEIRICQQNGLLANLPPIRVGKIW